MSGHTMNRSLTLLPLCCLVFAMPGAVLCAEKERGKGQYGITQMELQSQLMGFADQLAVILGQARYEVSAA